MAKLSENDVVCIRREMKVGACRIELSQKYGVQKNTITAIAKGKIWKHLPI